MPEQAKPLRLRAEDVEDLAVMSAAVYWVNGHIDWVAGAGLANKLKHVSWLLGIIVGAAVVYFATLFAVGFRIRDFKLIAKG